MFLGEESELEAWTWGLFLTLPWHGGQGGGKAVIPEMILLICFCF